MQNAWVLRFAQDDKNCPLPELISSASKSVRTKHLHTRKLKCLYCVYRDVAKINLYGFRFRRGGEMKTHKLWAWMLLLASLAFVLQFSTAARAQDNDNN